MTDEQAQAGTSIPLTIETPPVPQVAKPVGICAAVWPRGQGQVPLAGSLAAIPAMPMIKKAKGSE